MRQVKLREKQEKVVYVGDICYHRNSNSIIAYETDQKTGLGILVFTSHGWGFAYHSEIVRNNTNNLKFMGDNPRACIHKALACGRTVHEFSDFEEYIKFAANYTKL